MISPQDGSTLLNMVESSRSHSCQTQNSKQQGNEIPNAKQTHYNLLEQRGIVDLKPTAKPDGGLSCLSFLILN